LRIVTSKQQLRSHLLAARNELQPELKQQYSVTIEATLFRYLKNYAPDDHHLLAYRALPDEVDTAALFGAPPCAIYAPRMHGKEDMHWLGVNTDTNWINGTFGILEPESGPDWADEQSPAVLLCPLVGFDRSGNRLGMGKGCFDRWLATYRQRIDLIIGLAFSCQEADCIPTEAHDIPLDIVITEKEVISCRT